MTSQINVEASLFFVPKHICFGGEEGDRPKIEVVSIPTLVCSFGRRSLRSVRSSIQPVRCSVVAVRSLEPVLRTTATAPSILRVRKMSHHFKQGGTGGLRPSQLEFIDLPSRTIFLICPPLPQYLIAYALPDFKGT